MDITINWDNYNAGNEDGVRVYRSTNPIPDSPLPEPIATLSPGTDTYIDNTVALGVKYYYRVGIFKGDTVILTENEAILTIAGADTGPGPQTLRTGDWDSGVFGFVKPDDIITYANLTTAVGLTVGYQVTSSNHNWVKVAYKGKILYIALGVLRSNISYKDLYLAGAVYGTDDNGLVVPNGVTPTNQYKPINVNDFVLIPRILQGLPAAATSIPSVSSTPGQVLSEHPGSNEHDDILGPLVGNGPRWPGDTDSGKLLQLKHDFSNNDYADTGMEYRQQVPGIGNTQALMRGGNYSSSGRTYPYNVAASKSVAVTAVNSGSYDDHYWRPVLELVM